MQYYDIEALIASDSSVLMVAEQSNALIGCGYARFECNKPYFTPREYAYLGFMFVAPQWRGQGVIQLIVAALLGWARNRGVTAFKLEVYHQNRSAQRAYEKLGFKAEMVSMLKFD